MTDKDRTLLSRAHKTSAIDNQLVYKMMDEAESDECRGLLKVHYHYLYAKEEEYAGLL